MSIYSVPTLNQTLGWVMGIRMTSKSKQGHYTHGTRESDVSQIKAQPIVKAPHGKELQRADTWILKLGKVCVSCGSQ